VKIAKQNYTLVYQGIGIFRDEMLPFVRTHLEQVFSADAWEVGVRKHFTKEEFDALEKNFMERFKGGVGPARPATDKWEILGVNNFFNIIDGNWKKVFAAPFNNDRTCLSMFQEITRYRNPVMHTETGDLKDDDAWRALDTMYRLLATIESTAQNDLQELKNQLRRVWAAVAYQPAGLTLGDLDISYSGGLNRLEQAIIERVGKNSEVHRDFLGHKRRLNDTLANEKKGTNDQNSEAKKEKALRELDALSLTYLDIEFADACLMPLPGRALTPDQAARKVRSLEDKVNALTKELNAVQINRILQYKTDEVIPVLERKIQAKETELAAKKAELEQLRAQYTPPSYFIVTRTIEPAMPFYFVEQLIKVRIEITNAGAHAAKITYKESLPDSFVTQDKLNFVARIEPGQSQSFTYSCYASSTGEYNFVTSFLRYSTKTEGWERLQDTPIIVQPGTAPRLEAKRQYRHTKDGIEVFIHLENKGTRIARHVAFSERLTLTDSSHTYPLEFQGDLIGGESHVIDCQLVTREPSDIQCPSTVITFQDTAGSQFQFVLPPDITQLEYDFSHTPPLIGRQAELDTFTRLKDRIWQSAIDPTATTTKHLILIEGTEGTGKTRLVNKFSELAAFTGFRIFTEDCKDRSPIKRMVRRLLEFPADTDDNDGLFTRIAELLPGELYAFQRERLFRLISSEPIMFDKDELNQLKSAILLLLKRVCARPSMLIFENAQLTPVGTETDLLLETLYSELVNHSTPLLLCVTYRPGETGMPHHLANLKMSSDYFERISLGALKQPDTESLLRQIIPFPELNQQLRGYIFDTSDGNPFYLIELLRLLTLPSTNYLKRVGGEWYPAQEYAKFRERIPTQIETLILERAKLETGQDLPLLRILSVIGFEVPLPLAQKVLAKRRPELNSDEMLQKLDSLERAGFLVELKDGRGYEFEHQLKREVLYNDPDFPDSQRRAIRDTIAQVLLSETIYSDSEEQIRQLARHLARGTPSFRAEHIPEVIRAARLESDRRNFPRSLEYYSAVLETLPARLESTDTLNDPDKLAKYFDRARMLIGRSQVYQFQASWVSANRDLESAYGLVAPLSVLDEKDPKTARELRVRIDKERGRVLLRQNRLNDANNLLYRARIGLEGNLRLKRFFPPKSIEFHRDLVDIYLDLAEIFLRKQEFGPCRAACRRAESLAKKAADNLHDHTLLPLVYLSLGRLYQRQGKHDLSLRWLQNGLRSTQAQKPKDEYLEGRLLGEIANCYRTLDDANSAIEYYDEATQIQEKLGDNLGLAQNLGGMGDLYFDLGNLDRAKYFGEQAHPLQRDVNDQESFWRTAFTLALLHAQQHNFVNAARYWAEARVVLIDRRFIDSVKNVKKEKQIHAFLKSLADYYRSKNLWEERIPIEEDLSVISPIIVQNRDEIAHGQIELGDTYFRTQHWNKALEAYSEALSSAESSMLRAEIHEALGDTHAAYEPPHHTFSVQAVQSNEFQDRAEHHYLEATKAFAFGDSPRAISVFQKLVERIIVDEDGLLQFPFTFHRLFEVVSIRIPISDQFVDKSVEILASKNLPSTAGDILVYAARLASAHNNTEIPFEKKIDYLHRAEFMYRKGTSEDLIWGFNMMIPTYFRLGLWNDVANCFEQLFELNLEIQDAAEFIHAFRAISVLESRLKIDDYKRIVFAASTKFNALPFSDQHAIDFLVLKAKAYSHFGSREAPVPEKEFYLEQAMGFYQQALDSVDDNSRRATILNDMGLIHGRRGQRDSAIGCLSEAILLLELSGTEAAYSRINRAEYYVDANNFKDAQTDFEIGVRTLEQKIERWDARLNYVDTNPLSPDEVSVLHYEKHWLAFACNQYAIFLLKSNPLRAKVYAEKADRIYRELGDESGQMNAVMVGLVSSLSTGQDITRLQSIIAENVTVIRVCPRCKGEIDLARSVCRACGKPVCPACGAAVENNDENCKSCGAEFNLGCPSCGGSVTSTDSVCPHCGESLED